MKNIRLHSIEFEKVLQSEVRFLDKYGMFIIVLLFSFSLYVVSSYPLRELQTVNWIGECSSDKPVEGNVYTLNIEGVENLYIFSRNFQLIFDNNWVSCSIVSYNGNVEQKITTITFVSSKELNSKQIESASKGFVKAEFNVTYRTLVTNPIKSLLWSSKVD